MLACLPASASSAKILSGGALMTRSTLTVLPSIRQLTRRQSDVQGDRPATRVPLPESPAGSCSTRQAMAWIRSPRLYVAENLGRGVRVACRPTGCSAHPAQHRGGFRSGARSDRARPADEHRVDEAGCQQRPQLGRGTAAVDDFQHPAQRGVGEDRRLAHRMGTWPVPRRAACGCWVCRAGRAHGGVWRRNVACDDGRHVRSVLDVAGRRLVLDDGHDGESVVAGPAHEGLLALLVKGHSPTHRLNGSLLESGRRVLCGSSSHNRARRVPAPDSRRQAPEPAVTVGSRDIDDESTRRTGPQW